MKKNVLFLLLTLFVSALIVYKYLQNSYRFITLNSESMQPTYRQGAIFFVKNLRDGMVLKEGDLVVYRLPRSAYLSEEEFELFGNDEYFGRAQSIEGGSVFIDVDNPESLIDSNKLGTFPYELITALSVRCVANCKSL